MVPGKGWNVNDEKILQANQKEANIALLILEK